jgi:hypothetical protein
VVSLLLGVPLLLAGLKTSSGFLFDLSVVLAASVPAWSMIAGAVGASARRKARYAIGLLVFALVFDVVAFATGWQALANGATVIRNVRSEVLVGVYRLLLVSGPVVTLMLFAGKRPSVFWEAGRD